MGFGAVAWANYGIDRQPLKEVVIYLKVGGGIFNLERGAGSSVSFLANDDQRSWGLLDRVTQPKPGGKRNTSRIAGCDVRQIKHHHTESASLNNEIRGFERFFCAAAAA